MTDDRIEWILDRAEGPNVLDLGCVQPEGDWGSEGWLHGRLVDEFEAVIGVDHKQLHVNRLVDDGYDVQWADVATMDIDFEADTIVAGELIEHLSNPGLMLDRAREHLKPGGRLLLTTPNPWGIVTLGRIASGDLSVNDGHAAWYGPTVLEQLLGRYGFTVDEMTTTRRSHGGLMRLAQLFDSDYFGGSTWCCAASVRGDI